MGEDITDDFIQEQAQEEVEEKEVKTEEALKPFAEVIDKGTAFLINRVIQITGEKYQVEITEKDKIKPEEISEIGFGEAVVRVIDYYFPQIPADHPLLGLAAAGMMLGTIAYVKIEGVKARAKKKDEKKNDLSNIEPGSQVQQ